MIKMEFLSKQTGDNTNKLPSVEVEESTSICDKKRISEVEKIEQNMLDDDDMYQSMNEELDKQIAEDMEAIKNFLNNPDESVSKRIEFFNKMAKTGLQCDDTPVTDHILYQHTPMGNIKWHECPHCDYKSQDKSKLMEHLIANHSTLPNGAQFTCSRCHFKTRISGDLQRHLENVHNQRETFDCKECDKIFKIKNELLKHMEEAHNIEIFKCLQCSFISADRANLRQHNLMEHIKLNVSWYKCAQCAYRTVRKTNLDRHIMYKHSINNILL